KYGEELAEYFRLRKIPFYSKRSLNLFEIPLAQKIILLLKYLEAEHDIPYSGDEMLFEILHFDWFHIPSIEIAKLSVAASETKYGDNPSSLRKMIIDRSNAPAKDLFSNGIHEGIKKASAVFENLISDVPNITLQHLFENIIRKAGVLNHIMQSPDKHWQLQVLTGLFDFIKEESHRNPSLSLKELIRLIELMESEELSLPLVQVGGDDKGVNLLTAHGAKGLEFESVFFAGCNSAFWEKKRKPGGGYSLPDTIFSSQSKHNEEEELRRLFYVAITRTQLHLHISYSRFKNDGKELEPSMFIAEILDQQPLPVEKIFISEEIMSEFAVLHFAESAVPE
ncbi:MAG: 3'-5' exonuclease, partial [Bacteroidia bacterium]